MIPFRKAVTLRGALGRDAGAPTSEAISDEPCIVLALLIEFISSDKPTGLRIARNLQVPVVCTGPDFCGADQDMKEGDLIEVEGELRLCEEDGPVVWSRDPRMMRVGGIKVRASHVRKIDPPVFSMETLSHGHIPSEATGHVGNPVSVDGSSRRASFLQDCPAVHSTTRSVLIPAPCGTARLCFGYAALRVSAFRKSFCRKQERKNIFRTFRKRRRWALGSGARSRRFAQECPERKAGQIHTWSKAMNLSETPIKLRGHISTHPVVSDVETTVNGPHMLFELSVEDSGFNSQTGEWGIRVVELTIACPGPDFAGVTPDIRKGDFIQVAGEPDLLSSVEPIVVKGYPLPAIQDLLIIRAIRIRRLEWPGTDTREGENG